MAFPASWPPRVSSSVRSIRFYVTDTATANFVDKAYMFAEQAAANVYTPLPVIAPGSLTTINVPDIAGTGLATPSVSGVAGPLAQIWSGNIRITATTQSLEFSFDGTNVHGLVKAGESVIYRQRYEAGIAVRGNLSVFTIEAW